MKPSFIVIGLSAFLAGCGLPPAVTALSFALDGVSLAASGKTTGELALSEITQMDCALWRVLKGDPVCREETDGTLLAETEAAAPAENRLASADEAARTARTILVGAPPVADGAQIAARIEPAGGGEPTEADALPLTGFFAAASPRAARLLRGAEGLNLDMITGA